MAYMKKINISCRHRGCKAQSKFGVWGYLSGFYGHYCAKHAKQKVAELTEIEKSDIEYQDGKPSTPFHLHKTSIFE